MKTTWHKNEDDLTQKMKTTWPKKRRRPDRKKGRRPDPKNEDDQKMKTTKKWRRPKNEDQQKMKTTNKWRRPKNEDDQKMRTTKKWGRPKMKTTKNEDDQNLKLPKTKTIGIVTAHCHMRPCHTSYFTFTCHNNNNAQQI